MSFSQSPLGHSFCTTSHPLLGSYFCPSIQVVSGVIPWHAFSIRPAALKAIRYRLRLAFSSLCIVDSTIPSRLMLTCVWALSSTGWIRCFDPFLHSVVLHLTYDLDLRAWSCASFAFLRIKLVFLCVLVSGFYRAIRVARVSSICLWTSAHLKFLSFCLSSP